MNDFEKFCMDRLAPDTKQNQILHCVFGIIGELFEFEEPDAHKVEEAADMYYYATVLSQLVLSGSTPNLLPITEFLDHVKRAVFYKIIPLDHDILLGFVWTIKVQCSTVASEAELQKFLYTKLIKRYNSTFTQEEAIERRDKNPDDPESTGLQTNQT